MIPFPPVSPTAFTVTLFGYRLTLRWYALAYIAGLLIGWGLVRKAIATPRLWVEAPPINRQQLEELMTWVILGVILGGRIGYVLFYQPSYYFAHPFEIFQVWKGGMSFHGGFIGVALAGYFFCRREGIPMIPLFDLFAMATPPGLMLGRIANFVNDELWGRPTNLPWGVVFPGAAAQNCGQLAGLCARHPSQLYEAFLEGILLGGILLWGIWRGGWLDTPGRATGTFITGYGLARFIVEFFRQPDPQFVSPGNPLGLAWQIHGWGLTQGQALSLPMIFLGLWFIRRSRRLPPLRPPRKPAG